MKVKQYHYEIACKSQEDFAMAIKAAKENEREEIKDVALNLSQEITDRNTGDTYMIINTDKFLSLLSKDV